MELILLQRVAKLGLMGQRVNVKPGFARNYLLPQGKALRATKDNVAYFEAQRTSLEADNLKEKKEAEAIAEKMAGLVVIMVRQASEAGHLYGSVTARDIAAAISTQGFQIQRQQVTLDRPVKELGLHKISIDLHPEVSQSIILNIAQSTEEAAKQWELSQQGPGKAKAADAEVTAEVTAEEDAAQA